MDGKIDNSTLSSLTEGLELDSEIVSAKWAEEIMPGSFKREKLLGSLGEEQAYIRVCVAEGSKHFVKRLLDAAGIPVLKLARLQFGPYALDDLKVGEIREVSFVDLDIASN